MSFANWFRAWLFFFVSPFARGWLRDSDQQFSPFLHCALRYLDLRYPDLQWRDQYPRLTAWYQVYSQRPACQVI